MHQPYYSPVKGSEPTGRTLWGLIGIGVGGFQPQRPPPQTLIVTTTRSHSDKIVQKAVDSLSPTEVIRIGGAGQKVGKNFVYLITKLNAIFIIGIIIDGRKSTCLCICK